MSSRPRETILLLFPKLTDVRLPGLDVVAPLVGREGKADGGIAWRCEVVLEEVVPHGVAAPFT